MSGIDLGALALCGAGRGIIELGQKLAACRDGISAQAILWTVEPRLRPGVIIYAFERGLHGEALAAVVNDVMATDAENLRRAAGRMHAAMMRAANAA